MKICTKCNVNKENIEFPKRKANKDGLYSWCKECCRKIAREYSLNNPEKIKETREKRREKANAHSKIYKKLNAEKIAAQRKLYYEANKEKICEISKKYGKNKTEEQKLARKEYYLKWRESESGREYLKNNWKESKKKYRKHYYASQKVQDAIRSGKLIRSDSCSICLSKENIEGHHADYDKPLEVIWVCRKCHKMIHKNLKQGE